MQTHELQPSTDNALPLYNIATGYLLLGNYTVAERWYQLVLMLDPDLATAHQNLAVIYEHSDQLPKAASHRARAYRIQRVYIEAGKATGPRVLILCTGGLGNIPIETLLPVAESYRIKYVIDHAAIDEDQQLPGYDLVFNAIGDPDTAEPLTDRLAQFVARCRRPILNPPTSIARTLRHHMGELLADIDNAVVPACIRIDASIAQNSAALTARLAGANIAGPILSRPAGTHGGKGLKRCETPAALANTLVDSAGQYYLSQFCDYRSGDGCYRKYRMIFIDREPFPYHLVISSQWMVHYFSADMTTQAWKIDEERRFLENPRAALGESALACIAAIGRRLDLDYCGIDFACLPDGRVLVFEANATMLVHPEPDHGVLAHKNLHVRRIVDAFERLQGRRLANG